MIETIKQIEVLHVVVGVNPPTDDQTMTVFGPASREQPFEGLAAMQIGDIGWMPLVASGEAALERLRALVASMKQRPDYDGRELRILRFTRAEVVT